MLPLKLLIPLIVVAIGLIAAGGTLMMLRRRRERSETHNLWY